MCKKTRWKISMWPSCHARTEGLSSTEADPPHKAWTPSSCPCTNCSQQDSKLSQGPSNSQNLEADLNCSPVYVTNWWCWLESTAAEWCVARCACGLSPTWFIKCKRCNEPVLVGLARLSLHPQQENGWTDPRIDCSPPLFPALQVSKCSACCPLPWRFEKPERRRILCT